MQVMTNHHHDTPITHPKLNIAGLPMPVLLACAFNRADGRTTFPLITGTDRKWTFQHVRVVPESALRSIIHPKQRVLFEKEYGSVSDEARKDLLYALRFAQAIMESHNSARKASEILSSAAAERSGFKPAANWSDPLSWLWDRQLEEAIDALGPDDSSDEQLDDEEDVTENLRPSNPAFDRYSDLYHEARRNPASMLTRIVNQGIERARFVMWWGVHEHKLIPGLFCEDVTAALFALALSRFGKPQGLAACLKCGEPFITYKGYQGYCSHSCQTAAAQMRYRANKKKREKVLAPRSKQAKPNRRRQP